MFSLRCLPLLALPILALACASSTEDNVASGTSNLDTSGCSGLDFAQTKGAVQVSAERPPISSCWNVDESGLSIGYSWVQTNDATPQKNNLGLWTSLNGASTFQKADPATCEQLSSDGVGKDTSGTQSYVCTAWKRLDFAHYPDLRAAAYGSDGHRLTWDVQVAVALEDGSWDSLNGANYRFSL